MCDDVRLIGQLSTPDTPGPHPGVLVMPDARGMTELAKRKAQELASLGYVALATDFYGDGLYHQGEKAAELHADWPLLHKRIFAGFDALKAQPSVDHERIGAIGYCFGGQAAIELARTGANVKAAVSFHGLLTTKTPAKRGAVKANILALHGLKDPYVPPADVETFRAEMSEAEANWQITIYGEGWHQFTDPDGVKEMPGVPGLKYDRLLDRLSWAAALEFLDATLN
jgi:dienelactone hydrolase